ncbi:flagellar hook-basal body complex protein FliE [Maritalea sp.]|jgi:flagellar hook-basal body complex protein FliE|uniref:flagellar hook-basal body complex protein FliE n=1 Tax=Maritalea sp. TaxID=2003361 RepID=UPI0039E3C2AE
MSVPFSAASNAYASATKLVDQASKAAPGGAVGELGAVPDFGKLVAESIGSVVESGRQADKTALDLVDGKSNVVDMVTAISETEIALQTMVTIRDRVISAYEEIMRMPI